MRSPLEEFKANLVCTPYGDLEIHALYKPTVALLAQRSLILKWADKDDNNPVIPTELEAYKRLGIKVHDKGEYTLGNVREWYLRDAFPGRNLKQALQFGKDLSVHYSQLEAELQKNHELGIANLDIDEGNILYDGKSFRYCDYGQAVFADHPEFQDARKEDYASLQHLVYGRIDWDLVEKKL